MSNINDETVRAKMRKLRVSTFADVFYEIVNDEAYADALPEDIFLAAVEEAYTQRQQRNIAKAITQAQFRYPDASLAEVTRAEQRGINMRQLKRIAATNWRENPTNIHILAPTGTGKTYIVCAIGVAACQAGYSVAYYRLDQLVDMLAVFSPTDQNYLDKMLQTDQCRCPYHRRFYDHEHQPARARRPEQDHIRPRRSAPNADLLPIGRRLLGRSPPRQSRSRFTR